jgi:hypothetical protein
LEPHRRRRYFSFGGVATIDETRRTACRERLLRHRYRIDTLDCRPGLAFAVPESGRLLSWKEQFGYDLEPDNRNLDALQDGFTVDIQEGGGRVFEVMGAEVTWREDPRWLAGVLRIAQAECRRQLLIALCRRSLALLVKPAGRDCS